MSKSNFDLQSISENELLDLYEKLLQEKSELEEKRVDFDKQITRSRQRTIDLFGKMVDVKKARRIISWQNEELEAKNAEINKQKKSIEHTFKKFRKRTIELFGKMIDLKKAYKIIQQQKDEIEAQRKLLHETNASKDKFFSILAHDLKNPIGGFLGLTELMAKKTVDLPPEDQQVFVDSLYESSKQLYSLLENLLHWARSQTGSLQVAPQAIAINSLLESSINQVTTNAQLKEISIDYPEAIDTKLFVDKDTMITVLRNLLSNAIKYSKTNGTIEISVTDEESYSNISITDFGIGITPENLEKLFNIDQTISQAGTANEQGTGLGLILCKEFVELNKGKISVKSEINKGSTFSITIPLHKE